MKSNSLLSIRNNILAEKHRSTLQYNALVAEINKALGIPKVKENEEMMALIIGKVTACYNTTPDLILGKSRKADLVAARRTAVHIATKMGLSSLTIGRIMNRNHSSIIHLNKTFDTHYNQYPEFRKQTTEAVDYFLCKHK
ncbi:MAG: helix-turn-helix domain-containing protein [Nitrospinota bacterium]